MTTDLSTSPSRTLADALALPLDFVTESNGILAKKGAGKTNALVVLVEEMFAAGAPVVTIDPKGDHYGIRSSADGTAQGLPIPVFGGRHGDIPLEPTAGGMIADLVREKSMSVVLDVSEWTKGERRRFLTAFAERLYARPERTPMHLFLEECHEYIPQMVNSDDAAMVGVFERLVKLGRYKGIGATMCSQRSASVNKNVLTQIDNLFVMRTLSKPDRDVVKGWTETNAESSTILAELPSLQNGEAWLWQPERGEPVKFRFRMRHTFDAGATPRMGETAIAPTAVADVDLVAVADAMQATIERAAADDPAQLRRDLAAARSRISTLERDLAEALITQPAPERVEIPTITDAELQQLDGTAQVIAKAYADYQIAMDGVYSKIRGALATQHRPPAIVSQFPARTDIDKPREAATQPQHQTTGIRALAAVGGGGTSLPKASRAVLTVLAQRGVQTVQQVGMLAGYSSKGGGFRNTLSSLRTAGFIGSDTKGPLVITDAGLEALGEWEPLPSGPALVEFWLGKAGGKAERLILEAVVGVWPESLTPAQIAAATGYSPGGGGFRNSLSRLRTLGLIEGMRDIVANTELGEAARQ